MIAPPTLDSVLEICSSLGVVLAPNGDRLRIYPAAAVDESLLAGIRHHKQSLLARLTGADSARRSRGRWTPNAWCQYGHPQGWRSIFGPHLICRVCHPPATESAVAELVNAPEATP